MIISFKNLASNEFFNLGLDQWSNGKFLKMVEVFYTPARARQYFNRISATFWHSDELLESDESFFTSPSSKGFSIQTSWVFEDKFIPVRDVDIEPEEEIEDEETAFSIEGEDLTGRNFAANTWNKVEKQTLAAFESLADQEDRELLKDYLLTNLKLYFDKFEDELQASLSEPESPDYEMAAGEEAVEDIPAL